MEKTYTADYQTTVFMDYFLSQYLPRDTVTWCWDGTTLAIIWKDFDDYLDTVVPLNRIHEYFMAGI